MALWRCALTRGPHRPDMITRTDTSSFPQCNMWHASFKADLQTSKRGTSKTIFEFRNNYADSWSYIDKKKKMSDSWMKHWCISYTANMIATSHNEFVYLADRTKPPQLSLYVCMALSADPFLSVPTRSTYSISHRPIRLLSSKLPFPAFGLNLLHCESYRSVPSQVTVSQCLFT